MNKCRLKLSINRQNLSVLNTKMNMHFTFINSIIWKYNKLKTKKTKKTKYRYKKIRLNMK